jgi:nucleotide-binding universal stress UspA family protein
MKKTATGTKGRPTNLRIPETEVKVKRILAPTDLSEVSMAALPQAIFLARSFSAELILLHVIETFPIDYMMGLNESKKMNATLEDRAQEHVEEAAGRISYPNVKTAIRWGKPFQEIVNAADELNADLIVLATHGHTGLKHVYLGSTAERVVRHARRPVLVVRSSLR